MRTQAELANAVAEKARVAAEDAKLEDEKVDALQAEVQFAISTMEEMKAGLTSAGQAALVARREAEQAKKAAEHAGDGTGEHVTQVFREILGLAAKGRPRTLHKATDEPPPEPREPRHGFDDEPAPMAMIGVDGKFKELNPSFCRLVGYQEHEFAKAAWPSPHDRQLYAQQQEQFSELISGKLESVPVQSTFMHGQGLMVQVIGEITAVKGEDGLPSHLLLRAEERERANLSGRTDTRGAQAGGRGARGPARRAQARRGLHARAGRPRRSPSRSPSSSRCPRRAARRSPSGRPSAAPRARSASAGPAARRCRRARPSRAAGSGASSR